MISLVWFYMKSALGVPGPVDIHVGKRLKAFRVRESLSSADLASVLSVTPRLIEVFEAGRKRLSASQLFILSRHLDVPVAAFFDRREATL